MGDKIPVRDIAGGQERHRALKMVAPEFRPVRHRALIQEVLEIGIVVLGVTNGVLFWALRSALRITQG